MATLTSIQDRNEKFIEELDEYLKQDNEKKESLKEILTKIGAKYDIKYTNASFLYYKKYKQKLKNDDSDKSDSSENTVISVKKVETATVEKPRYIDNIKDIISINHKDVRVISYKNQLFMVAKDVLKSIGINSTSTLLLNILNEENKAIVPVKSTQGFAKTLIISAETCMQFVELVSEKHTSKKLRAKAKETIMQYRAYFDKETQQTSFPLETNEETVEKSTVSNIHPLERVYRSGEKIQFKITHIGTRAVFGYTNDEYRTSASINIADVTDAFVSDLNDYFTKDDIIIASIKMFDAPKNQVYLMTRGLYAPKQRPVSIYELKENQKTEVPSPSISLTLKENDDKKHEMTFYATTKKIEEKPMNINTQIPSLSIVAQRELDAIIQMINEETRIGALSSEAKSILIDLLNEKGLVNVITSIKDAANLFKPDLGVMFMKVLEDQSKKVRL